jgi:hypothetical protein
VMIATFPLKRPMVLLPVSGASPRICRVEQKIPFEFQKSSGICNSAKPEPFAVE